MRSILLLTCLAASPAFAQCPTEADLTGGILITEMDGTTNQFTGQGNGIVQNDGRAPDGFTYRNRLAQGTHLIELGDTDGRNYINDSRIEVSYPQAAARLPIPTASSRWNVETVVSDSNGRYPESQTQSWGAMTTLTIGNCSYDMIPGKVSYTNADYVVFEGLYYLPELKFAFLNTYQIKGEDPSVYTPMRIEAVR